MATTAAQFNATQQTGSNDAAGKNGSQGGFSRIESNWFHGPAGSKGDPSGNAHFLPEILDGSFPAAAQSAVRVKQSIADRNGSILTAVHDSMLDIAVLLAFQ